MRGPPLRLIAMRLTIAIPTYNRAELLRQTLEGVTHQDLAAAEFEILVIDNNSTDATRAVVAAFADRSPAPRYVLETRQGLNHGRNRALAEAVGEVILFADDDILVAPDWARQMLAPFDSDAAGRVGAVGGEVIPIFPQGLPLWIAEWHAPLAFRAEAGPLLDRQVPMGANLAIRRRVFEQLGPFQTNLDRTGKSYLSGGDSEMIRRIRRAGLEIWFAPAAAVRHQMPASRTTFRYAARHAFDSARSRIIERAAQPGSGGYLASRFGANLAKGLAYLALALAEILCCRFNAAKKALVRAWRSCGYLYQILRSWRNLDRI
jgi:glycosyltransferase involved in cell wall biosynthesis